MELRNCKAWLSSVRCSCCPARRIRPRRVKRDSGAESLETAASRTPQGASRRRTDHRAGQAFQREALVTCKSGETSAERRNQRPSPRLFSPTFFSAMNDWTEVRRFLCTSRHTLMQRGTTGDEPGAPLRPLDLLLLLRQASRQAPP